MQVLVDVNPERLAHDAHEPWHDVEDLRLLPAGSRPRTPDEVGYAEYDDEQRRPSPVADPQVLYTSAWGDDPPHARMLHLRGVDGLRAVPLNQLPWPRRPDDCRYVVRT